MTSRKDKSGDVLSALGRAYDDFLRAVKAVHKNLMKRQEIMLKRADKIKIEAVRKNLRNLK